MNIDGVCRGSALGLLFHIDGKARKAVLISVS